MAKQNSSDIVRTAEQKYDHYKKRIDDPKLTQRQRSWAALRVSELSSVIASNKTVSCPTCKTPVSVPTGKYTDGQKYAYGAGIGYAKAKAGARVDCKPENKDSFRKGYEFAKRK